MTSGKESTVRSRTAWQNLVTALVIIAAAVLMLGAPLRALGEARRAAIGTVAVTAADSGFDAHGRAKPLAAKDSLTVLVFLDARYAACMRGAQRFDSLATWGSLQGIAIRLLSPDSAGTERMARAGGSKAPYVTVRRDYFEKLGMHHLPAVLFVDSVGVVRGRLIERIPQRLTILNRLNALQHLP